MYPTCVSLPKSSVVANCLQPHISLLYSHLSDPLQSACRKHHSIESALLKVHNDVIVSIDKGEVRTLTLLDLSAASEYLTDLLVGSKCSKYLHSTNSNRFFIYLETKTG